MSSCSICSGITRKIFSTKLAKKYDVDYFECIDCGFLQTEFPYWLDEVYADAISPLDTGILSRNIVISRQLCVLLGLLKLKGKFLDYAGGYGILVRLMRDYGFNFYWSDPYAANMFAKGFEAKSNDQYSAVVAIETFEHLPDPIKIFQCLSSMSSTVILTTALLPQPVPAPSEWWYYMIERGGHISFYTVKAMEHIARSFNLKYYKIGNFHVFSPKKVPLFYRLFINVCLKFSLFLFPLKNIFLTSLAGVDHVDLKQKL